MVVIKKRYNIKILIELLILFIYINKRMLLLNYNNKNYFLYEKNSLHLKNNIYILIKVFL
jgi:hypothetical protein